jgi:hypothetical protein
MGPCIVADGILVSLNGDDNRLYGFGKGITYTEVTASPKISSRGNNVLIEGKVNDQSPGAKDTPAVSEASMSQWMEYVYMQKPKPKNATGVLVSLDVIDTNGNFRNIGTATSDANGFYSFVWTPDIEGKYTIIATFQGSESYWPSDAETAFVVNEAAPTPTPQPIETLPPTEMYFAISTAVVVIAIAIATLLIIKKRP